MFILGIFQIAYIWHLFEIKTLVKERYWIVTFIYIFFENYNHLTGGIFPSPFLQPVNGSKNSIFNWAMKLNLFMVCFFFFFFEKPLKDFHSIHLFFLLFLWFRYLQKRIKESCIFLANFSTKLPKKPLKFPEKSDRSQKEGVKKECWECIFQWSEDLNFKNFLFGTYHDEDNSQWYWTKLTVKKLNLCAKTGVDKSAWTKLWINIVISQ